MKQLVFNYIQTRIRILRINIANTFNTETAYPAENWANMLSTLFYTATFIIFLNIIFGNVRSLAGYNKNEMLFFSLVSQLSFYTLYSWSYNNMENLVQSIRMGELDLLLTKPLPTLFYVSTREFSIIKLIRDAFLPIIMISLLINWSNLNLTILGVIQGLTIFICGQWAMHVIQLLLVMPAFWKGQSENLLSLSYTVTNIDFLPLEGVSKYWRILFTTILPTLIPIASSVSVMLGHGSPIKIVTLSITVAAVATVVRIYAWRKGLAAYNSASS